MYRIELNEEELKLVREAVRTFMDDFGHDEVDVLRRLKALLAKLPAA